MTPNTDMTVPGGRGFYKTGQAAKELSISTHEVRSLCESGLIRGARMNENSHWRVPASEVARLKRDGVPPVPILPGKGPGTAVPASRRFQPRSVLLADPSPEASGFGRISSDGQTRP